jgi:hypothetical protein
MRIVIMRGEEIPGTKNRPEDDPAEGKEKFRTMKKKPLWMTSFTNNLKNCLSI